MILNGSKDLNRGRKRNRFAVFATLTEFFAVENQ